MFKKKILFIMTLIMCLIFFQVDLKHIDQEKGSNVVDVGIDLKEYYLSVEWDILAVPATRWLKL